MNAACAALALALSLCLPGLQDAYEQGPADNAPRVIVQVDHLQQVRGHLVKHDDAGLHIRSLNGDVIVVDPDTAFSVVQLFDANDPVSVVVHMRDGRTIPGTLLIDDWDHVKLDVHGVRLTLGREDVLRVTAAPDVAAMYRTSRAALSDDDEHGRMALARWLMNKKAWTLARTELEDIVARFDNVEAAQLLPQARAHAAVAANTTDPTSPRPVQRPAAEPTPAPASDTAPETAAEQGEASTPAVPTGPSANVGLPALPEQDIVRLIRVMELDPLAPPAKLRVPEQTRRRLHLGWSGSRRLPDTPEALDQLLKMSDAQALQVLFDLRARPLYGEIQVPEPPPSLVTFDKQIHDGWLATRCGTSACHGGPDAGRFRLYYGSSKSDALRTANLLMLETTSIDAQPLLDWTTPANSLLIQHALPRASASQPHPRVPGWRPVLNGDRLETALRWMRSMRQPRPVAPWPPDPMDEPDAAETTP